MEDLSPFVSRVPSRIMFKWGAIQTPLSKYSLGLDQLEVYLFPNLLGNVYGSESSEERNLALRSILNHEFYEATKHSPAGNYVKRLFASTACALTSGFMDMESVLGKEDAAAFNTPEALRLVIDVVCRDVKVDRSLLTLPHYAKGFSLSHRHYVETGKNALLSLSTERSGVGFTMNMNPYSFLYELFPAMGRSVVNEQIRCRSNPLQNGYLGRFGTFVKDWIISRRIRYQELKSPLFEIHKELGERNHNKKNIRLLSRNFLDQVSHTQAMA